MKTSPSKIIPVLVLFPLVTSAASISVNTLTDEDNGALGGGSGISLREAVKYSDAGSTITFTKNLSGQTLRLTLGVVPITRSLSIDGSALSGGITISGDKSGNGRTQDDTHIFTVSPTSVLLDSLTISGGRNIENGGAIICYQNSALTLNRCTVAGNSGLNGGAIASYGSLTLQNCCFSGNAATQGGGAIYAFGALEIQNTTISGNKAYRGGGISIQPNTTALIQHATLTGNTATTGIGRSIDNTTNQAGLTLWNCIVTENNNVSISGAYSGYSNFTKGNPLLAPLGNYGGRTQTMPPLPGSPAINMGNANYRLSTDQRTLTRLGSPSPGAPSVGAPDIGAVEYQGTADLTRFWKSDFDGDGSPYGTEQALGTDPLLADAGSTRNLAAPTFNASGHAVLSFGLAAVPYTRWVLKRSPDLSTGSFQEIYSFDGSADLIAPGISVLRTASGVAITDRNPPAGGAFYRLEVPLVP